MSEILATKNLCKNFGKQKANENISITVRKNTIYGLLGPNGAGKSTLLKMITGMITPSSGEIYFDDKSWERKYLSNIGALIESPPIYENLTAFQNLKVRALLYNLPDTRIEEVLKIVDLTNTGKKRAGQFSMGMKQRLGIAIALLNHPTLLILDEPTNGLSPLIPVALALITMGGSLFLEGAFNWWYTLILPGTFSMIVSFAASAEKKFNHHGLFAICINKRNLWFAQILTNSCFLLILNLMFLFMLLISGMFFGIGIPFIDSLNASLVLFLTLAWQIPILMFLSEKMGYFVTIMISLICNWGFGIFFSPTKLWFVPFAIPARLMCPIIKVMPNGLPLTDGNKLADHKVIMIGIAITIVLFVIFSFITALWFERREVK